MSHQNQTTEVGPGIDSFLHATHHPGSQTTTLESLDDEDVGQVGECDVVGDETSESDECEVCQRSIARETIVV